MNAAAATAVRIPKIVLKIIEHLLLLDITSRSRKAAEVLLLAIYKPIHFKSKVEIDDFYMANKMTLRKKDQTKVQMILCTIRVKGNVKGQLELSNEPCSETLTPEKNGTYCRHVWTKHFGLARVDKVSTDGTPTGQGSGKMERKSKVIRKKSEQCKDCVLETA